MSVLGRTINRARRRVATDCALRRAGTGLILGCAAGLGVLGAERLGGLPVWIGTYPVLLGAAALLGAASAMGALPQRLAMAVRLDRALLLKDRLGTAEAAAQGRVRGVFADLARYRGERLAESLDVSSATPIRLTTVWAAGALLGAVLTAGVLFLPRMASAGEPAERAEAQRQQRTQIARTIEQAVADLDEEDLGPESRRDVDALEKLARQLTADDATELPETRDQSAARLDELADRLAEQADRQLEAIDEVTRRFAEIETPEVPGAPPESEAFAEALRDASLNDAAERFDELMEEVDTLSPSAREALAEQLRHMGEELTRPPADEIDEARQGLREALQDLGVQEETIEDLLQETDDDLQRQLQEEEVPQETIDEITRDLQELQRQEEVRREVEAEQQRVAEALEETARRIESPEPEPRSEPEATDAQPPGDEAAQEPPDETRQPTPSAPPQEVPVQQEQREQAPGDQPSTDEIGQQPRQVPGPPEPEAQPKAEPKAKPTPEPGAGAEEPAPSVQPPPVPQDRPADDEQQPGGQAPRVPEPGAQPPTPPQDAGAQPSPADGHSVSETLRRLAQKRRDAMDQQKMSEGMRRAARELADSLTEEEKQRIAEQWMARGGDPRGGPGAEGEADREPRLFENVEDLDLRGRELADHDRVIAQWLGEDHDGAEAPGTAQALVRRARAEAEQAVEKSVVPSRYHSLIQRYFGRLADTVEAATPPADESSP